MFRVMAQAIVRKIGRGIGWTVVAVISLLSAVVVSFLPFVLLPINTDFVNGQWFKIIVGLFAAIIPIWRFSSSHGDTRLSIRSAAKAVWQTVTTFMIIFWPMGLAIWFNAYNSKVVSVHDMVVTEIETNTLRPAVTPIKSYNLQDLSTNWTSNLEVTTERNGFLTPGRCVRITVRNGRLGLDWISEAKPIACPPNYR